MPNAAAIYARISSDPDGNQLGVSRQVSDCLTMARLRGWPVADQYIDDDRSAYSGKPRPEYRRMLDDIRARSVDAVVVWHVDRLVRQPRELEEFLDLCDAVGVRSFATVSGDLDLANNDNRMVARILGALSKNESDTKSRRIKRKHQELAQAGAMSGGGTRPFGYMADRRTVNPAEAPFVREASRRLLAGDSLRSIAVDFNTRGISTPTGRTWVISVLRRMLFSARISGQREHHGEIVARAQWNAIITPDETLRLRALLSDESRKAKRTPRRYLLAGGLLRCSLCGADLVARPRVDGVRRYVCARGPGFAGCGKIAIMSEPIEHLVQEAVLYRLDTPALAAALRGDSQPNDDASRARDSLDADHAQLEQLATLWAERQITLAEYLAARKPIEARIDAARRALARAARLSAVADYVGESSALRSVWDELPLPRQRAIIAAVLDRATVGPAVRGRNFFDADRVTPTWRV